MRDGQARIIDNNELAEQKIQVFRDSNDTQAHENEADIDESDDGFKSGINAEQLEQLTQDRPENEDNSISEQKQSEISAEIEAKLDEAQQRADEIIRDAESKAGGITEDARKSGYEQGYASGEQDAADRAKNDLDSRMKQIDEDYERKLGELEPQMVNALTKIYEHVFDVRFSDDKNVVLHLLKIALGRIQPGSEFRIHVSTDDYDKIVNSKEKLQAVITLPDVNFDIIEDSVLNKNECIIETDGGIFDCSVGTEMKELESKLKLLAFDRRNYDTQVPEQL